MPNFRTISNTESGDIDEIYLTFLAGDVMLNTRVKADVTVGQFVRMQLKKVPHDESKQYGIFLRKGITHY
jgi:hypothetical protein